MRIVKAAETARSEQQIGDHLRDVRTRQGLSVRALAARAGCSPSFISQVEHGQASPSIASLERLVQALGMTLGETAHCLTRGDAATFSGETPHRWENVGREPARIVVVAARAR